jgi:hypothetical protein
MVINNRLWVGIGAYIISKERYKNNALYINSKT